MKLYPYNIDSLIGFDEIKAKLGSYTQTELARNKSKNLKPSSNKKLIEKQLLQTTEMGLLLQAVSLPNLNFVDILKSDLEIESTEGKVPTMEFLVPLKFFLSDSFVFFNFFEDVKHSYKGISEFSKDLQLPVSLFEWLDKIIDSEGKLNPNASPELKRIIDEIIEKEKEIRKILNNRFEVAKKNGWAGDTEITIRNDRLVIPIVSEFKKKIPGFVHDVSASGKYLYIEPLECFEENNRLRELYIARKKEIDRILRKTGQIIGDNQGDLKKLIHFWVHFDFVSAKSKLSKEIESNVPESSDKAMLRLIDAVNPVLKINLAEKNNNQKAIPNSFKLDTENRILLISGPNAGGKSVLLKTTALLQIMYQSGLPITAAKSSELFVYESLFVELSDNQSIENNLSTYSAHLTNMRYILEHADENTLFILDELGSGTDPMYGGPLAEAMLEKLVKSKAKGIVTTHLGSLKNLPKNMPSLVNASMQYDPEDLKPLFKLVVGRPGSSFAFELAQNLGFSEEILKRAKQKLKEAGFVDLDDMQLNIEKLSFELEKSKQKIIQKEEHLEKLTKEYQTLKKTLEEKKAEILKQARQKAIGILGEADVMLQKTKSLQKNKTANQELEQIKKQIQVLGEKQNSEIKKIEVTNPKPKEVDIIENAPLKIGDKVRLIDTDQTGEVIGIKGKKIQVLIGDFQTLVDNSKIGKLKNQQLKKGQKRNQSYSDTIIQKQQEFKSILDLRGERGDIALLKFEKWLDNAYLLGINQIKVIHGRGDGILKKLIAEFLKTHHSVKKWEYENQDMGGDGATNIFLK
jgi:DNA mismatch repair protein MutS2